MLKTTRFTLWSYRLALPAMMAIILFVTYCNLMGNERSDAASYASGMLSSYLVMMPFVINLVSISTTVQFSLTMGQTRRALAAELPVLNLAFTALMELMCYGSGLVMVRLVVGQWTLAFQSWTLLLLIGGWALGAMGQLHGLLGMRFGWRGWLGGFLGVGALGGALVAALIFPWGLREKLAALLRLSAGEPTLASALICLAAAAVLCAACHAVCWLLLRRHIVK